MRTPTILLTGAGAPGASGIIKSLRSPDGFDPRLYGVDMDPQAYGFPLVDDHETVPAGTAPNYVDEMLTIVDNEDVDVVLPLTTKELSPLASNKRAFEDLGATVMVSDPDPLTIANNKAKLYQFLDEESFNTAPEFTVVDDREQFRAAVEELGYPENKVCFKKPVGSGQRGYRLLDPDMDRVDLLLNEKPTNAVTTLEDVLPVLDEAESFPEFVVMEYLPGAEYSVDVLARGEEVPIVIPRTRAKTRAGISFGGTVERNETLIQEAREICTTLGLDYNVNLQFKYDTSGDPTLIEINPRVSGTIVMCVGAGANLPYLATLTALGEEPPSVDIDWGTSMRRYWQEVFYNSEQEPFWLAPESSH